MASGGAAVDTRHTDMIHDAQFDYYGKRVATCSSDKTIKIHSVSEGNTSTQLAELRGHEGPVWQVAWAHPRFGSVLASCSYDRRVLVWKEKEVQSSNSNAQPAQSTWEIIYQYAGHELSVNSIAWAPHDQLVLACASSDGYISILTYKEGDNKWETTRFVGHNVGANSVSWAPAVSPSSLLSSNSPSSPNPSSSSSSSSLSAGSGGPAPRRLVSGGSDRLVKLWSEIGGKWVEDESSKLSGHNDWVRDVAWAPSIGLPGQTIASCSQDCTVIIWSQADPQSGWTSKTLTFKDVVWRASWSVTGNILAVASGDNLVSLWKEQVDGEWKQIQSVDEPLDS